MKLRVAVAGAGWWSNRFHLPTLAARPDVDLVALCDPDLARAQAAATRFGVPRVYADHEELFADSEVDALVIATPHATHAELAMHALVAGAHVFVEKSMTVSPADARELTKLADSVYRVIMVGHTYHFAPTAAFARTSVQRHIGELVYVSGEFQSRAGALFAAAESGARASERADSPHPSTYSAAQGGGQAYTQLSHLVGLLLWTTSERVVEVSAAISKRGMSVDVENAAVLRFLGGAIGAVASTGSLPAEVPLRQTISYVGSAGSVLHDLVTGRVELHRADGSSEIRTPGQHELAYPATAPVSAFVDLVTGARRDNPADGHLGAHTVEVLDATLRSARSSLPVRIPTDFGTALT